MPPLDVSLLLVIKGKAMGVLIIHVIVGNNRMCMLAGTVSTQW